MRTSDAQREFRPSRCPVDGMISELTGGGPDGFGVTGVTRLMDTGGPTGGGPFGVRAQLEVVVTRTITFPVWVPVARPVGSAYTVSSMPSGGSWPDIGTTRTSHGS